jgi:hypothetical protein
MVLDRIYGFNGFLDPQNLDKDTKMISLYSSIPSQVIRDFIHDKEPSLYAILKFTYPSRDPGCLPKFVYSPWQHIFSHMTHLSPRAISRLHGNIVSVFLAPVARELRVKTNVLNSIYARRAAGFGDVTFGPKLYRY